MALGARGVFALNFRRRHDNARMQGCTHDGFLKLGVPFWGFLERIRIIVFLVILGYPYFGKLLHEAVSLASWRSQKLVAPWIVHWLPIRI